MSTLSQFFSTSGIGTTLVVNCFTINDVRLCGDFDQVTDNPLGSRVCNGFLLCRSSGVAWIVSPRCAEVSRNWCARDNAVVLAQTCTGCTGWFVPTVSQLQNPGYTCRQYWDSFSSTGYWSSTEADAPRACFVCFNFGAANNFTKSTTICVRAFRCVTY
jgi:hypothetical protein